MYLYPARSRILSACFLYDLTPDQLRMAVATLRDARHGLDSWVVPALEFSYAAVKDDHPETFEIIPELLASCRTLPVAKQWKRVRAQYFVNTGVTPPETQAAGIPARKSRTIARRATQSRKPAHSEANTQSNRRKPRR
jgi:hypothetical protein